MAAETAGGQLVADAFAACVAVVDETLEMSPLEGWKHAANIGM